MRYEHPTRWSRLLPCLALVLALAGLFALTGCGSQDSVTLPGTTQPPADDGGTQPPPAGQPRVTLGNPSPAAITAGAAGSVVEATVVDADGAPVAGQTVTFTASPSSVGQLSAASAVTDASGVARVTVTGLQAGSASVKAQALGVTSALATVTVLAPLVAVEVSPADGLVSASRPDGAGATITITVTDQGGTPLANQTVSFDTTLGVLDATSRNTDADGKAFVKLTSETAGQVGVTGSVLGVTTTAASVTVLPAALQEPVTVTTSANKIPTNGTATITIRATDEFGNPVNEVFDVAAVLLQTSAPTGNLSPAAVQLVNGQGTAVFTPTEQGVARIRVSRQGAQVGAVDISVELVLAGEPARIEFTVDPPEIAVQGGGGTQSSAIQIRVLDVLGDPIQDGLAPNNLEVEIVQGPNGGESLDGDVAEGATGLEWAVGNNANLGGGVFTTEGEAATVGGVARWSNTYAGKLVNSPVYIFAEAEGGAQGHGRFFRLAWRAETNIVQLAGPEDGDRITIGDPFYFSFFFEDSSPPTAYAIPELRTSVSATGGTLKGLTGANAFEDPATGTLLVETTPRVISAFDSGGEMGFVWTPPATAVTGDEFTLIVAGGGVTKRAKLTVQ